MRLFQLKRNAERQVPNKVRERVEFQETANTSWIRHRRCVDDMLHKLARSNTDSKSMDSMANSECSLASGDSRKAMESLRLKILMSLSLAEKSAQSDEGLMKVKRLKSKILSNFVRIDESSDASFVSWNSHHSFDSSDGSDDETSDEEMGYEVINHSTQDSNITIVLFNERPEESPRYYLTSIGDAFEVNIVGDRLLKKNYAAVPESGYEVSIKGLLHLEESGGLCYNIQSVDKAMPVSQPVPELSTCD